MASSFIFLDIFFLLKINKKFVIKVKRPLKTFLIFFYLFEENKIYFY